MEVKLFLPKKEGLRTNDKHKSFSLERAEKLVSDSSDWVLPSESNFVIEGNRLYKKAKPKKIVE